MRFFCFVAILMWCEPPYCKAQLSDKSWNVIVTPVATKSRLAPGVGITRPGPPFYVNLEITEPYSFSINTEVSREKRFSLKNKWFHSEGVGYSAYKYKVLYSYDETSLANNLSDDYTFQTIYLNANIGRAFRLDKHLIFVGSGLSLNYLIAAHYIYTSKFRETEFNVTGDYDRWNVGVEIFGIYRINVVDRFGLDIRPTYRILMKSIPLDSRMLYFLGIGVGVSVKPKQP